MKNMTKKDIANIEQKYDNSVMYWERKIYKNGYRITREWYEDGQLHIIKVVNSQEEPLYYKEYYRNGIIECEETEKRDRRWFSSGQIECEKTDKFQKKWYPNGQIEMIKIGDISKQEFYDNGQLKSDIVYNSHYIYYDSDGVKRREDVFEEDSKITKTKFYYKDGTVEKEMTTKNCCVVDGASYYKNGRRKSTVLCYDYNDLTREQQDKFFDHYKELYKEIKEYSENGRLIKEISFDTEANKTEKYYVGQGRVFPSEEN